MMRKFGRLVRVALVWVVVTTLSLDLSLASQWCRRSCRPCPPPCCPPPCCPPPACCPPIVCCPPSSPSVVVEQQSSRPSTESIPPEPEMDATPLSAPPAQPEPDTLPPEYPQPAPLAPPTEVTPSEAPPTNPLGLPSEAPPSEAPPSEAPPSQPAPEDPFGQVPPSETAPLFPPSEQPAPIQPAPAQPAPQGDLEDLFKTPLPDTPPAQPPAEPGQGLEDLFKTTQPLPASGATEREPAELEPAEDLGDLFNEPPKETPTAKPAGQTPESQPQLDNLFDLPPASEPAAPPPSATDNPFEFSSRQPSSMRTWSDNTGTYQVQGRLHQVLVGKVRLLKENGRFSTVPMNRLSARDQHYVQSMLAQYGYAIIEQVAQR